MPSSTWRSRGVSSSSNRSAGTCTGGRDRGASSTGRPLPMALDTKVGERSGRPCLTTRAIGPRPSRVAETSHGPAEPDCSSSTSTWVALRSITARRPLATADGVAAPSSVRRRSPMRARPTMPSMSSGGSSSHAAFAQRTALLPSSKAMRSGSRSSTRFGTRSSSPGRSGTDRLHAPHSPPPRGPRIRSIVRALVKVPNADPFDRAQGSPPSYVADPNVTL